MICSIGIFASEPKFFFGMGNDKFTNGISKNDDDQLTFSVETELEIEKIRLGISENSYTNRRENKRVDELELTLGYSLNGSFFSFEPFVGYSFYGNLNLQKYQNKWHKFRKVPTVDFTYEKGRSVLFGGASASLFHDGEEFDHGVELFYSVGSDLYAQGYISFQNFAKVAIGYEWKHDISSIGSVAEYQRVSQGCRAEVDIDMETFKSTWVVYPQSLYGYGRLSIDLLSFLREKTWQESDVYYNIGITNIFDMQAIRAGFSIPFTSQLSGEMEVGYVSGFPEGGKARGFRSQRNYGIFSVGLNYHPFQWFVSPYIEFDTGIGVFGIDYLSPEKTRALMPEGIFITDFRIGATLVPEGLFVFGNSTYQLDVYFGTQIIPQDSELANYVKRDMYHEEDFKVDRYINPFFGVGVKIGLDG